MLLFGGCVSKLTVLIDTEPYGAVVDVRAVDGGVDPTLGSKGEYVIQLPYSSSNKSQTYEAKISAFGYDTYTFFFDAVTGEVVGEPISVQGGTELKRVNTAPKSDQLIYSVNLSEEVFKQTAMVSLATPWVADFVEVTTKSWIDEDEPDGAAVSSVINFNSSIHSLISFNINSDEDLLFYSLSEVKNKRGVDRKVATIWIYDFQTQQTRMISGSNKIDILPTADGSGENVYFISNRISPKTFNLFKLKSDLTQGIRVVNGNSNLSVTDIDINPKLGMVLSIRSLKDPSNLSGIFTWNQQDPSLSGDNLLAMGEQFAVDPSGQYLAFIKEKQLYLKELQSGSVQQLTFGGSALSGKKDPSWDTDGEFVYFASDEGRDMRGNSNYDIWRVHRTGKQIQQITKNGSLDFNPIYMKSRNSILFISNRGATTNQGQNGIWILELDSYDQELEEGI